MNEYKNEYKTKTLCDVHSRRLTQTVAYRSLMQHLRITFG